MGRAGSVINLLPCGGPVGLGSPRPFGWEPSIGLTVALVGVTVCMWSSPCPSRHLQAPDSRENMGTATLTGGRGAEASVVKRTPCSLGQQRKTDPREKGSQAFPGGRPLGPRGIPRGGNRESSCCRSRSAPGWRRCWPGPPPLPSRGAEPEGFAETRYSCGPGNRLTREL